MDPSTLALHSFLSAPRFDTYLKAEGGDPVRASRLYAWNLEIGACFWGPISVLEVALRNTFHESARHGQDDS